MNTIHTIQEDLIESWLIDNIKAQNFKAIDETIEYFLNTARESRFARILFNFTLSIDEDLTKRDLLIPFLEADYNENRESKIDGIISDYYGKGSSQRLAKSSS